MYQYKMLYRPFGIGAQPKGAVKFTPADKATDGHHGIVEYAEELTPSAYHKYELEPYDPVGGFSTNNFECPKQSGVYDVIFAGGETGLCYFNGKYWEIHPGGRPVAQWRETAPKPAPTGLFIHYDNGEAVNIQDLPKPEYEALLDQLHATRLAYITLAGRN